MNTISKIDIKPLAVGIRETLLELKANGKKPSLPISQFEQMVMEQKQVSKKEAHKVTEAIIKSGLVAWEMFGGNFTLTSLDQ